MIDQMLKIISSVVLRESVKINANFFHADVGLISYSTTILYNLVFDKKIFRHVKDRKPSNILEQLYDAKDRTIQFAARTLAAILEKEEIDELVQPSDIARSFLYMIENTIDELSHTFHGIKLDGVLTNLEGMLHYRVRRAHCNSTVDSFMLYESHKSALTLFTCSPK